MLTPATANAEPQAASKFESPSVYCLPPPPVPRAARDAVVVRGHDILRVAGRPHAHCLPAAHVAARTLALIARRPERHRRPARRRRAHSVRRPVQ